MVFDGRCLFSSLLLFDLFAFGRAEKRLRKLHGDPPSLSVSLIESLFFGGGVMGPKSRRVHIVIPLLSISILLPPLPACRALRPAYQSCFHSVIGERDESAHLVECRHWFVGAADLDLVEEGLGAGAVFPGALRCACEDGLAWEGKRSGG